MAPAHACFKSMMPATTLPEILPVFPLTGSLLLPGNLLPLNVFEPRYRNMVADALEGGQHIGMVQPLIPRQDNWVASAAAAEDRDNPELYRIGCLGRIEECEPQHGRPLPDRPARRLPLPHPRGAAAPARLPAGAGRLLGVPARPRRAPTSSSTPRR